MKSENNALERAMRSVLFTGAITAFAVSPMAMAQEEGDDEEEDQLELGRQVVTGSRIKRIDLEEARPVVVITREDIELSGQESVADVLRNSPINTFGSSREVSGNAWTGQATISLHGIGSTRSLVLLDGRRSPRSPVTGNQANDLNWIPLAAVDRIEILTDSASAIYGSDAIGGVINVILRKDYDGLEAGGSVSRPTRDGANKDSGVLTVGGSTSRGRFLFSADFYNKTPIASRHRSYSSSNPGYDAGPVDYPNAPFEADWYNFNDTDNISVNGNTIWSPYFKSPSNCADVVDPDTGERLLLGPYIFPAGPSFLEFCGFDYAAVAWETQDIKRNSAFLHADYEISPDHAVRVQSMFTTLNYHGRYAPPLGGFRLTEESAAGLKESFDFDIPYPEFLPYTLRHRFIGLGNRDFQGTNTIFETALLAYGTVGMFDYELEARHQRYDGREDSCCYAKRFTTEQYVAQGRYNPFDPLNSGNASAYAAITANATRNSRADFRSYSGNVSFELFEAPAGPVGWAVGFDYFDEEFKDIYDPLSAGGDLIGSAGNSGGGERAIEALFAESYIPVLSTLELSAAVRWDSYDDSAGSEISSYLSARYQPTDWLLLRASWGEGFRAANMNNLYGALGVSYEGGTDLVACEAQGISPDSCPELQYATWTGGNPNLAPELSDSYNLGFVIDWEPVTIRMDYFTLKLEEGIGLPSLQGLINQERRGQCVNTGRIENTRDEGLPAVITECGNGPQIKRDPGSGALLEAEAPWANTSKEEHAGIDLFLGYDWETDTVGDFTFSLLGTRMLKRRSRSASATTWSSSLGEGVGDSARPKYQAGGLIRWTYTDHTVSLYVRHIAGYVRPEEEFSAPSHTEYDLIYRWATPWDGRITIGVQNLTDEDPELDSFASPRPAVYDLYSLDGRVPYVSYRHFF
ncbi:MAG: TonB-dependent receptor [Gammaproteobacteria bacterium]|nr:TonB-dependent receptor [Gammaproteobacteria bacterium]